MPTKPKQYRPKGYKSHDRRRGSRSKRGYDSHWYKVIRPRILVRDKFTCQLCGALVGFRPKDAHVDHIDNDGPDEDWNLRCLCSTCNSRKQNRTDAQVGGHHFSRK